jgi:pimeloyl-ACP methyl ester carboxylesterase
MGTSARLFWVTEQLMKTARHASFYLASGAETGPLIIFVHGWPELSHSWRHQLRCFGALGFRCVAPDMRGYGRSSNYLAHADYALEHSVDYMLKLLAHLGRASVQSGSVTTAAAR